VAGGRVLDQNCAATRTAGRTGRTGWAETGTLAAEQGAFAWRRGAHCDERHAKRLSEAPERLVPEQPPNKHAQRASPWASEHQRSRLVQRRRRAKDTIGGASPETRSLPSSAGDCAVKRWRSTVPAQPQQQGADRHAGFLRHVVHLKDIGMASEMAAASAVHRRMRVTPSPLAICSSASAAEVAGNA